MLRICLLLFVLLPSLALADHGRILYVSGKVTVERNGKLYRAVRQAKVISGDKISTGAGGRLHLRMSDRTLISLKPDTDFVIEDYRHAAAREEPKVQPQSSRTPRRQEASQDRSVFGLIKGGFRAITGLIGQRNNAAFSVETPVATIGIRGTSFVAELTPGAAADTPTAGLGGIELADASAVLPRSSLTDVPSAPLYAQAGGNNPAEPPRLTVGVGEGSVILTNAGGSLILENGEFGEVLGINQSPSRITRPIVDSEVEGQRLQRERRQRRQRANRQRRVANRILAGQSSGNDPGRRDERRPDQEADETVTGDTLFEGPRRDIAMVSSITANGRATQTITGTEQTTRFGSNGELQGFIAGADRDGAVRAAVFALSDGEVVNQGFDPETMLRWGRWSGAAMTLRFRNGEEQTVALDQAQLHSISSALHDASIALPVSGSRDFVLIGNTDPTDQNGNVGFLGDATLSADFTNQTVASSLALSIADQVWRANGSGLLGAGLSAATPSNAFAGLYDEVLVNSLAGGEGSFSGFFTNRAAGAGLSYRLSSGADVVHGTAAFAAGGSQ